MRPIHLHLNVGTELEASWNVMAHAQKPDFVFRAKRRSPFKSAGGRLFSRLLAAEVCTSAVVMLDTPCSEVVWRVLATHCIRQFPFHFPSRASPCAITFQLQSITIRCVKSRKWRPISVTSRRRTEVTRETCTALSNPQTTLSQQTHSIREN